MLEQRLTTEFYEDTLAVVIFDTVGCFSEPLSAELLGKNIEVVELPLENLDNLQIQQVLEQSYKILVILSPAQYQENYKQQLLKLQLFQDKVTVLLPVLSGLSEQVAGEIPYLAHYLTSQSVLIKACNELLPQSTFIFGQDTLLPPEYTSLFAIFCQYIQKGFIFAPNTLITPHTVAEFCERAVRELLRPHRSSVSIKGRTKYAFKLLEKVALQYENYYFCQVAMQKVEAVEVETLPFTVRDSVILTDEESGTLWFSRQLPSPEQPPFFVAQKLSFLEDQPSSQTVYDAKTPALLPPLPKYDPSLYKEKTLLFKQGGAEPAPSRNETTYIEQTTHIQSIETVLVQSPRQDTILDEFNVSSEIQRIFTTTRQEQKTERVQQLVQEKKTLIRKSKKKTMLFYGGLLFVSFGGLVVVLLLMFVASTAILHSQVQTQLTTSLENSAIPQRTSWISKFVSWQANFYSTILEVPQLEDAKKLVLVEQQVATIAATDLQSAESLKRLYGTVLGTTTGDVAQLTENIGSQTLSAYEAAAQVEQSLLKMTFTDETVTTKILESYQKKVVQLKRHLGVTQQLLPILEIVFGVQGRRSYALLLQNNQELRPTGGFLDAIAIVTFENGTLVDSQVYSSYELDKRMSGTVAAPAEITKALGQKTFSIYDANWSPDFPTSAATIVWFLEKILAQSIDGVLAIDSYGMQNIIEAMGPLELPEYNEVITSKNLLERLEFHSEVVLVETEKNHDYRKVLFSHLLDKVVQLPPEKVTPVLAALQENFTTKATMLAFSDASETQIVKNLGWSGAQLIPRCPSEFSNKECFIDHLMQVEANVGVNKANYYLKRAVRHTIFVSPTQADHTQLITFENTAQLDAWPKGSYRNYVRFFIPSTATNIQVSVADQIIPETQITRAQEKEFLSIGFLLEVPITTTKQVSITYSTPFATAEKSFSYVFFNNEQPGNGETPYSLQIIPVAGLLPVVVAPQAEITPAGITFTRSNDESSLYAVEFTQAK
jgi:hypothetical protein